MTSASMVIAIVVAAGEGRTPHMEALLGAAEEALGAGITLRVFEASPPTDEDALDIEGELGARAVVTLVWQDAARLRARTRMHVARVDRWTDRELEFERGDTLVERGRALGFAVASMLPEAEGRGRAAVVEVPRGRAAPERRFALGAGAVSAAGVGGGLGGALAGEVAFATSDAGALAARAGIALRGRDIPGLPGSDYVGSAAAGLAWWPLAPGQGTGRWLGLGLRADLLLLRHTVIRRPTDGDVEQRKDHYVPGADLMAQAAVALGAGFELVAALGAEMAFGKIDLQFRGDVTPFETIQPLRLVGEGGVRVRF